MAISDQQAAALYYARKRHRALHGGKLLVVAPSLSVEEGSANGTPVGIVRLVPSIGKITYSLDDDAGGRFSIDDGMIEVANGTLLVFADDPSHSVVVKAVDPAGKETISTVTILVVEA